MKLNIFYQEPVNDRWFKYDRYPRNIFRRILRGPQKPGGIQTIAINLLKGLDKIGVSYRFNDYKFAKQNPQELIGIIGKDQLLFEEKFKNPILFGAGVFSHPVDAPDLFSKYPNVKKILVPGTWIHQMFSQTYGDKVEIWPIGIDTEKWCDLKHEEKKIDFLIYDKLLWHSPEENKVFLKAITDELKRRKFTFRIMKYRFYHPRQLYENLKIAKFAIFLCPHETQGIAYQQILSTNTPILAYDKAEYWEDPNYFPDRVKFKPVSSVPYWDERCGTKFSNLNDFNSKLDSFLLNFNEEQFNPRSFILENLTLEKCAKEYVEIYRNTIL